MSSLGNQYLTAILYYQKVNKDFRPILWDLVYRIETHCKDIVDNSSIGSQEGSAALSCGS